MKTLFPALLIITACGNPTSTPAPSPVLADVSVSAGVYTSVAPGSSTAGTVAAFPSAVDSQITDSVTQANVPSLEALRLLDRINHNLEQILLVKGINVKDQTCESPPEVCR